MPRILKEPNYTGALETLTQKAEATVTSPEGRAGMRYTRDALALQQRTNRPIEILSASPFADGMLVSDVVLPGIRGQVCSFSGTDLVLREEATIANFAIYDPATDLPNATISACSVGTAIPRSGTVRIASLSQRLVSYSGGLYFVESILTSGSGNWSTAITGLAAGDELYGVQESVPGNHGAPLRLTDAAGLSTGEYLGPVVRVGVHFRDRRHVVSGVFVLRSRIQPAVVTLLEGKTPNILHVASKYASVADLWVF